MAPIRRRVDPSFLKNYGVIDVKGEGVRVVCSARISNESLKPNKLLRHMNTKDRTFYLQNGFFDSENKETLC